MSFLAAQFDLVATKYFQILVVDTRPVSQNRNKLECASKGKPCISDTTAPLELFRSVDRLETASLQFNGHDPVRTVFFSEEQVIATLLIWGNRQRCAIQINNESLCRRVIQRKGAISFLATVGAPVLVNFWGNQGNKALIGCRLLATG